MKHLQAFNMGIWTFMTLTLSVLALVVLLIKSQPLVFDINGEPMTFPAWMIQAGVCCQIFFCIGILRLISRADLLNLREDLWIVFEASVMVFNMFSLFILVPLTGAGTQIPSAVLIAVPFIALTSPAYLLGRYLLKRTMKPHSRFCRPSTL